jgi:putative endonuclease
MSVKCFAGIVPAYRQTGNGYYISPVCHRQASKLSMVTVYALYDIASGQIYVGMTNDIERRLGEHRRGQSFYTRRFKEFKVMYTENFENYTDGRKQEKYLKNGSGKEFLKTLIK